MADGLPMSGSIDPKTFPFTVMDLHRQGATGSLKVDGPSYQKALYFRGGRVLFGSSNDPRDQLGAILIESGKISPDQLEDVNTKVGPGNPLAKVLSESGFVSQRELSDSARAKVERILSDVITYTSGSFEFEDGVLPKGAVDLKLSTERVMLAAVRRITDRNFVLRHIESLEGVYAQTAALASQIPEIQSETGSLPGQLDGRRSLKDAASRAGMEEFEAAKVACGLLFLRFVEKSTASGGEEEPVFVQPEADEGAELDLGQTATMAFGTETSDSEATLMMPSSSARAHEAEVVAEGEMSSTELPFIPPPPRTVTPPPRAAAPPPIPREAEATLTLPDRIPAWEQESAPEPVQKPPSKEDLAALDQLLGSRDTEGPLEPMDKGQEWRPQFLPETSKAGKGRGAKRGGGGSKVGLIVGVIVVVAGAAAAGWFVMTSRTPTPAVVANTATPSPAVASPSPDASAPATSPSPAASESPSAAKASPSPSAAMPSAVPSAPATPPAKAAVAPVTTTTTLPSPTPAAAKTAAKPASPPPAKTEPAKAEPSKAPPAKVEVATKAPAGGAGLAQARAALLKGELSQAASGFGANVKASPSGSHTVQLLVACSAETVHKAAKSVSAPELYILSVNYKGRECYRVCWGIYDSKTGAEAAVHSVPDYFVKGGATPKVVSTSSILP